MLTDLVELSLLSMESYGVRIQLPISMGHCTGVTPDMIVSSQHHLNQSVPPSLLVFSPIIPMGLRYLLLKDSQVVCNFDVMFRLLCAIHIFYLLL